MAFVQIIAKTVNGQILEFPQTFQLNCSILKPLGKQVVRQYNGNECIVAVKVFMVQAGNQLLGTNQFETTFDFINYVNVNCAPAYSNTCYITLNGCNLTLNGCLVGLNY